MTKKIVFNPGELYFQKESGVEQNVASLAPRLLQQQIPTQHSEFYSRLTMLFVASVDKQGQPWASVLSGSTGFISVHNKTKVQINAKPIVGDPLTDNLQTNNHIGFLGLEFHSRRRNRFSGIIKSSNDKELTVEVNLAFGNCPKYIQTRKIRNFSVNQSIDESVIQRIDCFDKNCIKLISSSDTFFIASYYPQEEHQGADVSHRGGKPGFVTVEDDATLSFEDYSGNNLFMTLGNLKSNPVAGLLFINFDTGDVLQLACQTEISSEKLNTITRRIKLKLDYGWFIKSALTIDSEFLNYSPFLPS